MLKFSANAISQKDYNNHVVSLLSDKDCVIFFDTNILAKMFALYKGARDEFYTWVRGNKGGKRVRVPAWCLSEYTNRASRNELAQYSSNVSSSLKTTLSILPQLIRQLALYVDDATAVKKSFADRTAFLAKVTSVQDELLGLLPEAGLLKNNADTPATIHEEISDLFGDIILETDIFTLMQNCYEDYETRFANKIPPGFQDDKKDRNKIGDYIIWRELLDVAKSESLEKILYVSDDLKIDWVYAPQFIINARGKKDKNPEKGRIYLIDTRLEYEMSLATGKPVDIMPISFEQLVASLTQTHSGSFKLLADAVQLISAADATTATTAAVSTDTTGPEESTTAAISVPQKTPPTPVAVPVSTKKPSFTYSVQALADATYNIPDNFIGNIISSLRSYTWDTQNNGINRINSSVLNTATPDELFVLGRNILQSATGSSFNAANFVERFPSNLSSVTEEAKQHLFNGMLYEMYFDSHNEFRGSNGKTFYLDTLYTVFRNTPYLKKSGYFIAERLTKYKDRALYIPNADDKQHTIKLKFITIDSEYYHCQLMTCMIDGKTVSQTFDSDDDPYLLFRRLRFYDDDVDKLADAVRESRFIPKVNAKVEYKLDNQKADKEQIELFKVSRNLYV